MFASEARANQKRLGQKRAQTATASAASSLFRPRSPPTPPAFASPGACILGRRIARSHALCVESARALNDRQHRGTAPRAIPLAFVLAAQPTPAATRCETCTSIAGTRFSRLGAIHANPLNAVRRESARDNTGDRARGPRVRVLDRAGGVRALLLLRAQVDRAREASCTRWCRSLLWLAHAAEAQAQLSRARIHSCSSRAHTHAARPLHTTVYRLTTATCTPTATTRPWRRAWRGRAA